MRAAVYHGPGDLRVEDVPRPREPGSDELLIRVLRNGICGSDASEYHHGPVLVSLERPHPASGHRGPVTLGHEFVGVVEAVGAQADGFAVGDRVVSGARVDCGECSWCREGRTNLCARSYIVGFHRDGGLAEHVAVPARSCALVPDACSDESAAMAQPLGIALHGLDRAQATAGEGAAIFGLGGIGLFVLIGLKALGLDPIVAIDVSAAKLELAARLGATRTVNAAEQDAAAAILHATGGEGAPLVVESSGASRAVADALHAVRRGGRVLQLGMPGEPVTLDLTQMLLREVSIVTSCALVNQVDLVRAVEVLATSPAASLVHDSTIGLDEVVEAGLQRLLDGSAVGKILVDPTR